MQISFSFLHRSDGKQHRISVIPCIQLSLRQFFTSHALEKRCGCQYISIRVDGHLICAKYLTEKPGARIRGEAPVIGIAFPGQATDARHRDEQDSTWAQDAVGMSNR